MLIDEDRVAVRVDEHAACGTGGGLVGFGRQSQTSARERFLDVADVIEIRQRGAGSIPAGVERQAVLVEHALEQSDGAGFVLHDGIMFAIAGDDSKAEFLIEGQRDGQILDGEADGKIAETHFAAPFGVARAAN